MKFVGGVNRDFGWERGEGGGASRPTDKRHPGFASMGLNGTNIPSPAIYWLIGTGGAPPPGTQGPRSRGPTRTNLRPADAGPTKVEAAFFLLGIPFEKGPKFLSSKKIWGDTNVT